MNVKIRDVMFKMKPNEVQDAEKKQRIQLNIVKRQKENILRSILDGLFVVENPLIAAHVPIIPL